MSGHWGQRATAVVVARLGAEIGAQRLGIDVGIDAERSRITSGPN